MENLRVIYNQGKSNEVRSLDGVSVEIFPEEYVVIYGPSGCGKSTLLYSIAGLQAPSYGEVTIGSRKISQMKKKEKTEMHRSAIGLIFQAFYLIETLSVLDNVCLPKTFIGENVRRRREISMGLLRRFGIAEQFDKLPSQLSGGQKQRVAIARSLINNPQIILADEPVGNLDSESAENVMKILEELNEVDKKTIILVTHNPEHLQYADRIIQMKDGKVLKEEIIHDKRFVAAKKETTQSTEEQTPEELKILMRSFRSLTPEQLGIMLVPFKAKQVLSHVLSELSEEQINAAENLLKEFFFKNISLERFEENLDLDLEKGGAGWNKQRVGSFSGRIKSITGQAGIIKSDESHAYLYLSKYLIDLFRIKLDDKTRPRFYLAVKTRLENKVDKFGFQKKLDAPAILGGVGLYKNTAERVVREVEIIMLLKYST